jgi:hypothetical protein
MNCDARRSTTLILQTSDVSTWSFGRRPVTAASTIVTSTGRIEHWNTMVTFNVDFEKLLADQFEVGAEYTIMLTQYSTVPETGAGWNSSRPLNTSTYLANATLNIFLRGLNFKRSSYDVKTSNEMSYARVGAVTAQIDQIDNEISSWEILTNLEYMFSQTKSPPSISFVLYQPTARLTMWVDKTTSPNNGKIEGLDQMSHTYPHFMARFIIHKL